MKLLILFNFLFFIISARAQALNCEDVDIFLDEINTYQLEKTIGDRGTKIGDLALELENLKKAYAFVQAIDAGDSMSSREDVDVFLKKFFGEDYFENEKSKKVLGKLNATCLSYNEKDWQNCLEFLQTLNARDIREKTKKRVNKKIIPKEENLKVLLSSDKNYDLITLKKYFGAYYLNECDARNVEKRTLDYAKLSCDGHISLSSTHLDTLLKDMGEISFFALVAENTPSVLEVKKACEDVLEKNHFNKAACRLVMGVETSKAKAQRPAISDISLEKENWLKSASIVSGTVGTSGVSTYFLIKAIDQDQISSYLTPLVQNHYNPYLHYHQNRDGLGELYPRLWNIDQYHGKTLDFVSPYPFEF